ncbi:MAG: flagellar hook-length control protein FliK [Gammaproteobacteria bacterium]|nr:flagellar hook-length control protein FliK [Gammaproteobacteria bacterium]
MQVSNVLSPNQTLTVNSPLPVTRAWQIGQVLQAMVVTPSTNGRVALEVAGMRMTAETNLPLRSGQTFSVRVENQGQNTLLRIMDQMPAKPDVQAQAMRTALPRQTPLPPLLANLSQLAQKPGHTPNQPAQSWLFLARAIFQALPEIRTIARAEGLKQAVTESGTFFESRVAAAVKGAETFPTRDLKGSLLRLVSLLTDTSAGQEKTLTTGNQQAPPLKGSPPQPQRTVPPTLVENMPLEKAAIELRAQIEGSLSRIQLNQLNSLPAGEGTNTALYLEIPVRQQNGTDVWSVCIEQDSSGKGGDQGDDWVVTLAFALDKLGPISARITWRDEKISAYFLAEQEATATRLREHTRELNNQLVEAGLTVDEIICHQGTPPQPTSPTEATHILNMKA